MSAARDAASDGADGPTHDGGMIDEAARRLLAAHGDRATLELAESGAFPAAAWAASVDAGFDRALAAEASGGIGLGWSDAWPILRALGASHAPLPLPETMVATALLSAAGVPLPDGPVAIVEGGARADASVDGAFAPGAGARTVSGTAPAVAWARHARWLLVSLPPHGLALVDARDAGTIRVVPREDAAGLPLDGVALDGARVAALVPNPFPALDAPVRALGALAYAATSVGALERALELAVRYAGERVQFGKPIGRLQAIQQQLALLAGDVAAARTAARTACEDAPSPASPSAASAAFSIAVAKVVAGEAATRGAPIAHQVHGAIGFTREHALHHATRRLWAWRERHGSDAWWAARLGRAAIAGGQAGFWPSLVARRFDPGAEA